MTEPAFEFRSVWLDPRPLPPCVYVPPSSAGVERTAGSNPAGSSLALRGWGLQAAPRLHSEKNCWKRLSISGY